MRSTLPRPPEGNRLPNAIIEATGLHKRYGSVVALAGLDLSVPEGSIFGLLGPNGAGKTTAVSILTTLIPADGGSATVAGADVTKSPDEVRRNIGLSGQYAAVDEQLTGFENLDMVGRLYRLGKQRSRERARELLERFDLVDAGDRPVKTYSGGMRRRLDLAGALVAEPPVLFLDEPTTGLDPRSRTELWSVIRDLVARGATLLLTTQYMEEAERLADDIMEGFSVGDVFFDERSAEIVVPISGGAQTLTEALRSLDAGGVAVRDVGLRRPTLDDVFLTLTGHLSEEAADRPTTGGVR